jgi:hypothetical protein
MMVIISTLKYSIFTSIQYFYPFLISFWYFPFQEKAIGMASSCILLEAQQDFFNRLGSCETHRGVQNPERWRNTGEQMNVWRETLSGAPDLSRRTLVGLPLFFSPGTICDGTERGERTV